MESDVGRQAIKMIEEDRAAKAQRVMSGACSPEEYKYLCGEIHGLDLAKDHIQAVLKKENEDE